MKESENSLNVHQLDDPQCDSVHMGPQKIHLLHAL